MSARYWIAQHVPDVFRQEPRNVGVFVDFDGLRSAKFYGEQSRGQLDGRKLRGFAFPAVYRQWVDFWQKEWPQSSPQELIKCSGSHYRVKEGGVVDGAKGDSIDDVASYLYALLVSEGGFLEALGGEEGGASEVVAGAIEDEIASAWRKHSLLTPEKPLLVPNPILRRVEVQGFSKVQHKPAFTQRNGHLDVMETVDFTGRHKKRSRDHAGLSAYVFRDILAAERGAQAIALVKVREEDQEIEDVTYGLSMLKAEGRVVNWLDNPQREAFLAERQEIASRRNSADTASPGPPSVPR